MGFLQRPFFGNLDAWRRIVWEVFWANENIDLKGRVTALLFHFARDVVFHLGVAAARGTRRKRGGIGFGTVSRPGDVDQRLARLDLCAQHTPHGRAIRLDGGDFNGHASDGIQCFGDRCTNASEICRGG
jgi:hypothetical protein